MDDDNEAPPPFSAMRCFPYPRRCPRRPVAHVLPVPTAETWWSNDQDDHQ